MFPLGLVIPFVRAYWEETITKFMFGGNTETFLVISEVFKTEKMKLFPLSVRDTKNTSIINIKCLAPSKN
jgi:hypothetical protein